MKRLLKKHLLLSTLALSLSGLLSANAQGVSFGQTELKIGLHRIKAELATTDPQRMQGLMNRTSLGTNNGMLFKFDYPSQHCMWMKNTLIPLSVAFIDQNGRIINIEDMEPKTLNNHCAETAASYALEMNLGWFKARSIKAGDLINGIK